MCILLVSPFLAVTKGIVDLHRGKIFVSSLGEGCGSTFAVQIPLLRRVHTDHEGGELSPHGNTSSNCHLGEVLEFKQMDQIRLTQKEVSVPPRHAPPTLVINTSVIRALVVDDVAMNRKMLSNILKTRCECIAEAVNGEDAVRCVKAAMLDDNAYHVVFMDNQMPKMSGPEAAMEMRAIGYGGMIAGVTGCASKDEMDAYRSCGADIVLQKPLDVERLNTLLHGEFYWICYYHVSTNLCLKFDIDFDYLTGSELRVLYV